MAFIPPQGNKTVMVDNSNNIVYPASFQKVVATEATIAGNNFTDVPSVIDPENATTTQLPSVASVVNYVADVVEGGSSGLIPAIQSDIQTLGQVKSNRGEFWFNGGFATISNMAMNGSWSLCCRIRMQTAQVQYASIFHFGAFYLYWNTRLGIYCSPAIPSVKQISVDDNNRLANGEWHTLVVSYDGITLKLTDETGVLLSVATSEAISISGNLLIGESNYKGQIADVKYFNFDMSDANAPYTIADYIGGKDESPFLQNGNMAIYNGEDFSYSPRSNAYACDIEKNGDEVLITNTVDITTNYVWLTTPTNSINIKAGSLVECSFDSLYADTRSLSLRFRHTSSGSNLYTANIDNNVRYISFATPADLNYLDILVLYNQSSIPLGTTLGFNGLKIKVNGALLSLDDYSIKVGATQIVPDVSGNNNDATITGGVVMGSKDTSIAKMAQLFYQSQQG